MVHLAATIFVGCFFGMVAWGILEGLDEMWRDFKEARKYCQPHAPPVDGKALRERINASIGRKGP